MKKRYPIISRRPLRPRLGTVAATFAFALSSSLIYGQALNYSSGTTTVTAEDYPDPITSVQAQNAGTQVNVDGITVNNPKGHAFLATGGASFNLTDVTLTSTNTTSPMYTSGIRLEGGSSLTADGLHATVTSSAEKGEQRGVIDLPTGGSTANVRNATLSASGDYVHGLFSAAGASSVITDTTVSTAGLLASGLYAFGSKGIVSITANNVSITTTGQEGYGLYAASDGAPAGTGQITGTNITINTSGTSAFGIVSRRGGLLTVRDSTVHTSGTNAQGVRVAPLVVDSVGLSRVNLENVNIVTTGEGAHALRVDQGGELNMVGGSARAHHATTGGLYTTIGATVTLDGASISSAGAAIQAGFAKPANDLPAANTVTTVNLNNGTRISSDSGVLLSVTRTESEDGAAVAAGFVLNIGQGSFASGEIRDNDTKTTGYLDINVASGGQLTSNVIEGFRDITVNGSLLGSGSLDLVAGTSLTGNGVVGHNVWVNGGDLSSDLIIRGSVTLGAGQQDDIADPMSGETVSVEQDRQANINRVGDGAIVDASAGTANIGELTGSAALTVGNWGASIESLNGGAIEATSAGAGVTVTNVNAGTITQGFLRVENNGGEDMSASGQLLNVGSNATLSGNGTIAADVEITGALRPGNSPGELTFLGDLTLGSDAVVDFEIGETFDTIVVNGDLTYGGILNITFSEIFDAVIGQEFTLFVFAEDALPGGGFTQVNITDATGLGYNGNFSATTGVFTLTTIPEPSTNLLILIAGAGAAFAFRKRLRKA